MHGVVVSRPRLSTFSVMKREGGVLRNSAWVAWCCGLSGVCHSFLWNLCISPTPPLELVVYLFLDTFSLRAKGWRSPLDSPARTKATRGSWCTTTTGSIRSYEKMGCQRKVGNWTCLLPLFNSERGEWGFAKSSLVLGPCFTVHIARCPELNKETWYVPRIRSVCASAQWVPVQVLGN